MAAKPTPREPLSKDRIVAAAITFADAHGFDSLSMRKLATELGAGAMSLYNHVADKDELLQAMVDIIIAKIEAPAPIDGTVDPDGWRATMRASAISARDVYVQHEWALPGALRTIPGPRRLHYLEAVMGAFTRSGLEPDTAHHAYHAYEVHISGSALTAITFEFNDAELKQAAAGFLQRIDHDAFPHLVHHVHQHLDDRPSDFEFGLDLLLDGLERLRDAR